MITPMLKRSSKYSKRKLKKKLKLKFIETMARCPNTLTNITSSEKIAISDKWSKKRDPVILLAHVLCRMRRD